MGIKLSSGMFVPHGGDAGAFSLRPFSAFWDAPDG
jgi:hypothetical protein